MHKSVFVPIAAIAALAAVEIAAMHYGHNGTILYLVVTLIASVGGFSAGRLTAPFTKIELVDHTTDSPRRE